MKQVVKTQNAPTPVGPYSQAIRSGNLVFVAGQGCVNPKTGQKETGSVQAETRQALENVKAILEAAGTGLDRLVKTTVFLQSLDDFSGMNEVYARHVGAQPPARSSVEVAALPGGALVEIEAIAYV